MFEIRENYKTIKGTTVKTFGRVIQGSGVEVDVEAGTTGHKGAPAVKDGSRTYLRLTCWDGHFRIMPMMDDYGNGEPFGVEIVCCGDAELDAIMKALDFARNAVNDLRCGTKE